MSCETANRWENTVFDCEQEPEVFTSTTQAVHRPSSKLRLVSVLVIVPVAWIQSRFDFPFWAILATSLVIFVVFDVLGTSQPSPPQPVPEPPPVEMPPVPDAMVLTAQWRRILERQNLSAWVLFSYGTCVIFQSAVEDPRTEAINLLRTFGPVSIGTPAADMLVYTLKNNGDYVVGGHHPQIFTFVNSVFGLGGSTLPGTIGRRLRHTDAHVLNVIHVEARSKPERHA